MTAVRKLKLVEPVAVIEVDRQERQFSDVTMKWRERMKKTRKKGVCSLANCSKPSYGPKALWCTVHKSIIVKEQLKAASERYHSAVKAGAREAPESLKRRMPKYR